MPWLYYTTMSVKANPEKTSCVHLNIVLQVQVVRIMMERKKKLLKREVIKMNDFSASQSLPVEDWTSSATSQSICMKNNTMKRGSNETSNIKWKKIPRGIWVSRFALLNKAEFLQHLFWKPDKQQLHLRPQTKTLSCLRTILLPLPG